jgi:GDPmannose 4,6-dehydratase
VTRKITRAAAAISLGLEERVWLGNLDAQRDWGHAQEYAEGMWLMLQQKKPDDYVLATGATTSVREFARWAFEDAGILLEFRGEGVDEKGYCASTGRCLVEIDPHYFRPTEVDYLCGDASKAKRNLGWSTKRTARDLAREMVAADIALIRGC